MDLGTVSFCVITISDQCNLLNTRMLDSHTALNDYQLFWIAQQDWFASIPLQQEKKTVDLSIWDNPVETNDKILMFTNCFESAELMEKKNILICTESVELMEK